MSTEDGRRPLAMPADWKPAVRRAWPTVAFAAAMLAGIVALALVSGEANVPARTALLALALMLLPVVPGAYFLLVDPWRRPAHNVRLLELRASSRTATLLPNSILASFFVYIMCLAILAFSVFTALAVRPMAADGTALRVLATISPAVGVLAVAVMLSPVLRRRRELGLGMSPDHVHHWGRFGCYTFRWESIKEIRAATAGNARIELLVEEPARRPIDNEENWISRSSWIRGSKHNVIVGYLDVSPTVVYYALCFYHRHPELRYELGVEASLDRIQRLDFEGLEAEVLKHGRVLTPGHL